MKRINAKHYWWYLDEKCIGSISFPSSINYWKSTTSNKEVKAIINISNYLKYFKSR